MPARNRALPNLGLLLAAAGCTVAPPTPAPMLSNPTDARYRAEALALHIGELPGGARDAITDVPGVLVGHATLRDGNRLNTGVTVILPHGGNPFRDKVTAALAVQNGFGKLVGATQLQELGELESPIALTSTLNVHRVADGVLDWLLALPGNEDVLSANVVVGETNDGRLSDIRARAVTAQHVAAAIAGATADLQVGAVGAGAGTICCQWKGGIGSSSRRVGEHTLGVLVQTNFGGDLRIDGEPVANFVPAAPPRGDGDGDGSCMIVVATDAPLDAAALRRVATRAFAGMARAGASFSHGSGDYAIAFSTTGRSNASLRGDALSPLFVAVADATEQAILDSLCAAETTTGMGRTVPALPLERLRQEAARRPFRQFRF